MNIVLKIFLSMSFSGGLLIMTLLLGKRLLKDKISRQWQYYIWLIVVFRLLLPFGPETNLMGKVYQAVDQAVTGAAPLPEQQIISTTAKDHSTAIGVEPNGENEISPTGDLSTVHPLQDIGTLLMNHIWLVWLVAALGLLIRKITIYQGFIRYINAGLTPVSNMESLDSLSLIAEQSGVKKPIELCVNPIVSSPLLIGFFHPCIVLPKEDIPKRDFQYIVMHELMHYKRRDMFYKWLVQLTVCLHWFNPLVYLMSREINKACEFSCDEAVLAQMGRDSAQDYGQTLLDSMAAIGKYKENLGAVTLSENKRMLKERLGAIMKFKERSKVVKTLTAVLTLCVIFGAAFLGVYPVARAANRTNVSNSLNTEKTEKSSLPQAEHLPMAEKLPVMDTLDVGGTIYYLVETEAQLRAIGSGKYGLDQNYMQQADIRLSEEEWIPIGTRDNPFTGIYNGNGYEIIGLTMTNPYADLAGLFGVAKDASIYNVTMRDVDIDSAGRKAKKMSAGAILAIGGASYDNTVYATDMEEDEGQSSPQADDEYTASEQAEQYYEAGSLPLFKAAFSELDERAQKEWLGTLYADEDLVFFSAAVGLLGKDNPLLADYAEKAYRDDNIVFFAVLTDNMDEAELELWLDRALEDDRWKFQSMLFDKLNMDNEIDAREKEWEKQPVAEYQAVGVTMDDKNYYYQGQLVNIFQDIRANKSFYTLNMNPAGTVNIKIVRDANDKITGVAYMTEAEVTKLLTGLSDPDDLIMKKEK